MNSKGQTLIIFVILIPIFIFMAALVVDTGVMTYEYIRDRSIIDEGIKLYYEKGNRAMEELLKLNDFKKEEYQLIVKDEIVEVHFERSIASIFGKLINIQEYKIDFTRIGKVVDEKIIISKKE